MKKLIDTLDFPILTFYNNLHNKFNDIKSYDEDTGILLRFLEREGKAEIFLTRNEYLPPLNFNQEP